MERGIMKEREIKLRTIYTLTHEEYERIECHAILLEATNNPKEMNPGQLFIRAIKEITGKDHKEFFSASIGVAQSEFTTRQEEDGRSPSEHNRVSFRNVAKEVLFPRKVSVRSAETLMEVHLPSVPTNRLGEQVVPTSCSRVTPIAEE